MKNQMANPLSGKQNARLASLQVCSHTMTASEIPIVEEDGKLYNAIEEAEEAKEWVDEGSKL